MMRAHPLRLAALIVGMRIDGGAESLVRTLLYELKDTPCDTTVFTLRDIDPQSRAQIEQFGAHVVELPGRKLISPRRFARMVRALRAGRYDVIHTHLTGANLLGLLCGALLRIPVVVSLHSVRSSGDDHWYHGRLERQLIRRVASRVIAVGDETATARAAVLGDDVDIHVLPNAVTPQPVPSTSKRDQLRREVMTDTAGPLFLCVGRLTRAKAHAVLIDAFQHVRERLPDAELALAGDGRLRDELRGLTADLGLSDVVHFLGRRSDARDLIAAADVFVMSSVWEGLPMALLEAMQAETPIVATDVGDIAEVLQGTPSRVVAPGDADALADAMVATVDDIRAGLDLTTAGAFVVSERYSSATWADRVLDHYYSVASYRLAKGGDRYLAESA
jgi:glycosyltransferase involved in cell wall biosynthesis